MPLAHRRPLSHGIDALSLGAVEGHGSHPAPLSNGQILGLLEGSVRAFSNLEEALHHSSYWYLLVDHDLFIPLKYVASLMLLPAIASLLLRALAHAQAVGLPEGMSSRLRRWQAVLFTALMAHVICGGVLLLWLMRRQPPPLALAALATHVGLLVHSWAGTGSHTALSPSFLVLLMLALQVTWTLLVGGLLLALCAYHRHASGSEGHHTHERGSLIAAAACSSAFFGTAVTTSHNLAMGENTTSQ